MWLISIICLIVVVVAVTVYPKRRYKRLTPFQRLTLPRQEPSPQLKAKLTKLVGKEEAERLVARARFADPGKSEAYYFWKALKSLNRK